MENEVYDLLIVGGGPAGMTAAIYAARYNLKTILIAQETGGVANEAHIVDNWPGLRLSGFELMEKFKEHVESFKIPIILTDVISIKKTESGNFISTTFDGVDYESKTVILAMGTKRRKLNVPGEEKLAGRGVSYCATCDSFFFKGKVVAVIGGSDSALRAGSLLASGAAKVIVVYRGDEFRAEPATVDEFFSFNNVEVMYKKNVVEILGNESVEALKLDDGSELKVDGVFIEVGSIPSLTLSTQLGVLHDSGKYIIVGSGMETNVPGVYAAGDATNGSNKFRQIVTAAAEGAIAIGSIYSYLRKIKIEKH